MTGAGRGIGKGIATVFANEGARVLAVNRSAEAGQATADEIVAAGGEASFLQADVRQRADMERMAAACIERYGGIDVFCANAGIFPTSHIVDMRRRDLGRRARHQPQGRLLRHVRACIPQMKAQGQGRIVVISSITGPNVGWPGLSHYMASKGGGERASCRGGALELARHNITVNAISPGSIMTPGLVELGGEQVEEIRSIIPAGYIGETEDIAYAAGLPRERPGALHHRPGAGAGRRPDPAGKPRRPRRRLTTAFTACPEPARLTNPAPPLSMEPGAPVAQPDRALDS